MPTKETIIELFEDYLTLLTAFLKKITNNGVDFEPVINEIKSYFN